MLTPEQAKKETTIDAQVEKEIDDRIVSSFAKGKECAELWIANRPQIAASLKRLIPKYQSAGWKIDLVIDKFADCIELTIREQAVKEQE